MRLNPYALRPDAYEAVRSLSRELAKGPLEPSLRFLVEIRVSQLNRCGFCVAMHSDGARKAGVPQAKLDTLAGWREDSGFTDRERAALDLAESVTDLAPTGLPDLVWQRAHAAFTDVELADLLYLIGQMNLFNRINVAVEFPAELWHAEGAAGILASGGGTAR